MAVDGSNIAHAVVDGNGKVLYANKMARRLRVVTGGKPDERIIDGVNRALGSGELVDVEMGTVRVSTKVSRRRIPIQVQALLQPIARPSGSPKVVLVTAQDGTEALRLEEVRRDFLANVSHELKTPVSAISLLAEAVDQAAGDAEAVHAFARRLINESRRLNDLVADLIMLSRLQGAEPLPTRTVIEVDGVVAEAVARMTTAAEKFGIELVVGPETGALVRGDRSVLVTALTNLIDNAIRYSPAGTDVSVGTAATDSVLEISVTDRGIGIAPEHQRRVFERFFRVDEARSRSTGGTGLGLAIVKHAVANHGGRALLQSEHGAGSTFSLRLPRFKERTATAARKTRGKSHKSG